MKLPKKMKVIFKHCYEPEIEAIVRDCAKVCSDLSDAADTEDERFALDGAVKEILVALKVLYDIECGTTTLHLQSLTELRAQLEAERKAREGMVMVPKEPTVEMIYAADPNDDLDVTWMKMCAAAQKETGKFNLTKGDSK
jgi:hypothetical protein